MKVFAFLITWYDLPNDFFLVITIFFLMNATFFSYDNFLVIIVFFLMMTKYVSNEHVFSLWQIIFSHPTTNEVRWDKPWNVCFCTVLDAWIKWPSIPIRFTVVLQANHKYPVVPSMTLIGEPNSTWIVTVIKTVDGDHFHVSWDPTWEHVNNSWQESLLSKLAGKNCESFDTL